MASIPQNPSTQPPRQPLALRWRLLISLVLIAHLTAVIAAPMALYPSSDLQQSLARTLRPYIDILYLDHGYRFFAPSPGPSHLVRYTLEMPDGTTSTGTFPDLKAERPRLFYHRHFMLSEKFAQQMPDDLPTGLPAQAYKDRDLARAAFEAVARSYAQNLMRTSGARRVDLELIVHDIPLQDQVSSGRRLDEKASYVVLWHETFDADKS